MSELTPETILRGCETILAAAVAEKRDITDDEAAMIDAAERRFDLLLASGARSQASAPTFATRAELERFLRDAGLPRAAAKRVAAGGFAALDPDRARSELLDSIKAATARLSRKD